MLIEKLQHIKQRFEDVEMQLSSPTVMTDMKRYAQLNREYKDLKAIVEKFHEYKMVQSNLENAKSVMTNEKDE
jgi:peptide chain release factor 1